MLKLKKCYVSYTKSHNAEYFYIDGDISDNMKINCNVCFEEVSVNKYLNQTISFDSVLHASPVDNLKYKAIKTLDKLKF